MSEHPYYCLAEGPARPVIERGWVCTREPGHKGDHVATHVGTGAVLDTWPQYEEA